MFPRNWEIRLAFTKGRHHSCQQELFLLQLVSMLENAIQGKKYFRSLHYTAHTNHHREMFFSLFIVNLVGISNKR